MVGLGEKEVNFKNWKAPELKNTCRLEESLSPTKKEELVELTEKAQELALELTDESESISDVVNAKLVTDTTKKARMNSSDGRQEADKISPLFGLLEGLGERLEKWLQEIQINMDTLDKKLKMKLKPQRRQLKK